MVKMPWNRNRNRPATTQIPAEVEEYYQSTRKERAGIAWLLGIATLLLTLLIAAALFFGGRWLYRMIIGGSDDSGSGATQQVQEGASDVTEQTTDGSSTDSDSSAISGETEASTGNGNSLPGAPSSGQQAPSVSADQTPTTGPAETELIPRTGPTEE